MTFLESLSCCRSQEISRATICGHQDTPRITDCESHNAPRDTSQLQVTGLSQSRTVSPITLLEPFSSSGHQDPLRVTVCQPQTLLEPLPNSRHQDPLRVRTTLQQVRTLTCSCTGSSSIVAFAGWYSSCPDTRDERRDEGVSVPAAFPPTPSSVSLSGTLNTSLVSCCSMKQHCFK